MLLGDRIRLREIEREDLPNFVKWFNDPEVRRYLLFSNPMSMAKEKDWFESYLKGEDLILGIECQQNGKWTLIGNVGIHRTNWQHSFTNLGIVIGEKEFWGRGLGTDAIRTIVVHIFNELNLNRVALEVFDFNSRAIKCYEKAGFVHEGIMRQAQFTNGVYCDIHMMAILREDFIRKNNFPAG